jgi:hypothetical protein
MKPGKNKREISQALQKEVEKFIHSGGVIEEVPRGVSGNLKNHNPFNLAESQNNKIDRTPLQNLVKEIEARKEKKQQPNKKARTRAPRKKLITDDFGQPIRWIWEE